MRILLIDNYDSFTWNLAQYLMNAVGVEPIVVKNDWFSWPELLRMGPFQGIVVSPGPGTVRRAGDVGVARDAIRHATVPLLGVCLGHQGIAYELGGDVVHAPEPVHGRQSLVHHGSDDPLFAKIPSPFSAVRYHSLIARRPLSADLVETAHTEDGLVMALRHRSRPMWGVQFHPESVLTEHGHQLMVNFRDLAHAARGRTLWSAAGPVTAAGTAPARPRLQVVARPLMTTLSAEDLFVGLYGQSPQAYWLDSARVTEGLSRFSFMGTAGAQGTRSFALPGHAARGRSDGEGFLDELEQALAPELDDPTDLPFAFRGGWVGYFGYEMKALFGGQAHHAAEHPDALWMHAERFIAVDHRTGRVVAVAVAAPDGMAAAELWLQSTAAAVAALAPAPALARRPLGPPQPALEQERGVYLEAIHACQRAIRDGECYQICLTNRLSVDMEAEPLDLYRALRAANPAPFAAYIRWGGLAVLSASPERFLEVDRTRRIETKPIKGTIRRDRDAATDRALAEALRTSEKDRAENLMIVDLMRNDLSRVAEPDSVRVPRLMYIESYANVHQLVSTVQAQLRAGCTLVDLVRATFPGGSITGAPKLRAMQYIDQLEHSPRGVYCGSIGYLGYGGVMDLNIAIRTLVAHGRRLTYGAGGGITHLSEPEAEFAEIMLKAAGMTMGISQYVERTRPLPEGAGVSALGADHAAMTAGAT